MDKSPTIFNKMYQKLAQCFPTKLPITQDQLNSLINDVLSVNGLPNDPTYHHAIASAVMHLGPITHSKSKRYFAKSVRKSIANQVAFEKIQFLREEEKKQRAQSEVTPQEELLIGPDPKSPQDQVVS